ncbi:MAG: hypothetical protein AUH86_09445 [Acidobacteria bacterium 13_1_40CM_4_58_4]|nr:MAG: hypothetical protein AUH86_09445 [Acidobacteria bacterium 13_1_40CM_4_58_4]
MNDETIKKQESSKHPEFEQKDLSATAILSFLLGLAIFGVVIQLRPERDVQRPEQLSENSSAAAEPAGEH